MLKTILLGLIVLIVTIIDDVLIALYTKHISKNKRLKAATYSAMIETVGIFFLWVVLNDFIAILFGIVGSFIGTYYANNVEKYFRKIGKKK